MAAGRYGGRVRVILINDGSVDATKALALATMAGFRHAAGEVVDGRHGGKSESLNAALKLATSELVIRIDADTIVGEWSLFYTPRWFEDPQIGLVEPMCFPRTGPRSVFPHMRLFEELKQFGLNHRTMQTVDGVNVVPGVFTAFRRSVAVELGGFTVGMNGEDGDFTLRFSRLGLSHVDGHQDHRLRGRPAHLPRDPGAAGAVVPGGPSQPGPPRSLPGREWPRPRCGSTRPSSSSRAPSPRPGCCCRSIS